MSRSLDLVGYGTSKLGIDDEERGVRVALGCFAGHPAKRFDDRDWIRSNGQRDDSAVPTLCSQIGIQMAD
jgi:hypothetical protein